MNVNSEDMTVEFQHLGIQCVRKKDVEDSLKQRKEIRVDPFRMGWKHMENPSSIDLNAVKLCFQVIYSNYKKVLKDESLLRYFWKILKLLANIRQYSRLFAQLAFLMQRQKKSSR